MTSIAQPEERTEVDTPPREWNSIAAEWLERSRQDLWRRHSDAVNTMLIERWLPWRVLDSVLKTDLFDEAVTTGLYPVLSRHAKNTAAIDVSQTVIDAAAARYPRLRTYAADVRALPFEPCSFDAVVSISTLDHFANKSDIGSALLEIFRVLKPGGTLILTLDNAANPIIAVRNRLPYSLTHAARLVPYPTGKTLNPWRAREVVTSAGFEVLESSAVMHAPRVVAIPLMNLAAKLASPRLKKALLSAAMSFEKFGMLPTRDVTGHFIAIRARKP